MAPFFFLIGESCSKSIKLASSVTDKRDNSKGLHSVEEKNYKM